MKPAAHAKFLEWYNKKIETECQFNFDNELLYYCCSDVQVLQQCCMKFRDIFMEETDADSFEKLITIASVCNLVFPHLFLKPNNIGLIPYKEYVWSEVKSQITKLAHYLSLDLAHQLPVNLSSDLPDFSPIFVPQFSPALAPRFISPFSRAVAYCLARELPNHRMTEMPNL
uniref:Uncharacterized protein n=1 Tax=Romanomermis culicivorax TaxID=13658 RepID=A0A915KJG8_ROMCU